MQNPEQSSPDNGSRASGNRSRTPVLGLRILLIFCLVLTTVILFAPAKNFKNKGPKFGESAWRLRNAPGIVGKSKAFACRFLSIDDNLHACLFFVLAILSACLFAKTNLANVLVLLMILTGYSLCSELIQHFFIAGRSFEWSDLVGNEVGIAGGVAVGVAGRFLLTQVRSKSEVRGT